MSKGQASAQSVAALMYKTFDKALDDGNVDAYRILKVFNELKKKNPDIRLVLSDDLTSCYWADTYSSLVMGPEHIAIQDSGTFCHELGHCLYDSILDGELPTGWNEIVSRARHISSSGTELHETLDLLNNVYYKNRATARQNYTQSVMNSLGVTLEQYEKQWADYYRQVLSGLSNEKQVKARLAELGLNNELIDEITSNGIEPKKIAENYINNEINKEFSRIDLISYGEYGTISDIIASVFNGKKRDSFLRPLNYTYSHSAEYYRNGENYAFHEIIANFTQLKLCGNNFALAKLKSVFGEEFYNVLEETFNKFCDYK